MAVKEVTINLGQFGESTGGGRGGGWQNVTFMETNMRERRFMVESL